LWIGNNVTTARTMRAFDLSRTSAIPRIFSTSQLPAKNNDRRTGRRSQLVVKRWVRFPREGYAWDILVSTFLYLSRIWHLFFFPTACSYTSEHLGPTPGLVIRRALLVGIYDGRLVTILREEFQNGNLPDNFFFGYGILGWSESVLRQPALDMTRTRLGFRRDALTWSLRDRHFIPRNHYFDHPPSRLRRCPRRRELSAAQLHNISREL